MNAQHALGVLVAALAATTPGPAHAIPPQALASQTSDGTLTLVLRPERAWRSAELTIGGGDTIDLGAATVGQGIEVQAWAVVRSTHPIVLRVAEEDGRGVTFRFVVDTQVLPDRPPLFDRGAPREWLWRPFQRPSESGRDPATDET